MESTKLADAKWEGKRSVELKTSPPHQVWLFLADFCNVKRLFPGLETCYQVEGVPGQPGLTRYCAGPAIDNDETTVKWAKEKLISVDPIKRCLSYEIIESNMGFRSYVGTMQVVPMNNDEGCIIEWSFVCNPIEGMGFEDFGSFLESTLQGMGKQIEDALLSANSASV